jgi:hypothetical protein
LFFFFCTINKQRINEMKVKQIIEQWTK